MQFQDYVILLLAGACLGPLSNMKDTTLGAAGYFYTLIALGKTPSTSVLLSAGWLSGNIHDDSFSY